MNHETAISKTKQIADDLLAPAARENDKQGRFSTEAVDALGRAGLLGLVSPTEFGGAGLGPGTFAAVISTLAEADASTPDQAQRSYSPAPEIWKPGSSELVNSSVSEQRFVVTLPLASKRCCAVKRGSGSMIQSSWTPNRA
jgi:alkylation response protein AidB-like acyl-CoA dehydrogenase